MKKQYSSEKEEKVILHGFLNEFRTALEDEIKEIEANGKLTINLRRGTEIEASVNEYWYRFSIDYLPNLPADTPCKLYVGKDIYDAFVISFDEDKMIVSVKEKLPDAIDTAKLEAGSTVLLKKLIECIEVNANNENAAGERMLKASALPRERIYFDDNVKVDNDNTESQNKAILSAVQNNITFIWGPPGTGKTTVIGQIIRRLYKSNRTVLMVSHTNTAINGAIEKTLKELGEKEIEENCPILRVGNASNTLPENVLLTSHVKRLGKKLYDEQEKLRIFIENLTEELKLIGLVFEKIDWVQNTKINKIEEQYQEQQKHMFLLDELMQQNEEIKKKTDNEKTINPGYDEYLAEVKNVQAKKGKIQQLNFKVKAQESNVNRICVEMDEIQSELDKWKAVEKFRSELDELRKETALKLEIIGLRRQLEQAKNELEEHDREARFAKSKYLDYNNRGFLAKMWLGNQNIEKAKIEYERLAETVHKEEKAIEEISNRLEKDKNELDQVLRIETRIREQKVIGSKERCLDKEREIRTNLEEEQRKLEEIKKQYNKTVTEHDYICLKLREKESIFRNVINGEILIEENNKKIRDENKTIEEIDRMVNQSLEIEKKASAKFGLRCDELSNKNIIIRIIRKLEEVRIELKEIDVGQLNSNREFVKKEIVEANKRIAEIDSKLQELETVAIEHASVIGTTLTKSYIDSNIRKRRFDTVILDEASMATIPALWCAGYLAEKNIVIVGDFLQLSPIATANTPMVRKWLKTDIFQVSGIQDAIRDKKYTNYEVLCDQFRMEAEIADIANVYYGQYRKLNTNDYRGRRIQARSKFRGWFSYWNDDDSIKMLDTEKLNAWVTSVPQAHGHSSRFNCFTAAIDVELAFRFIEKKLSELDKEKAEPIAEPLVLIVVPYRPQVDKIKRIISMMYNDRGFKEDLNFIAVGTVHSMQGREADIVIIDFVVDQPHFKANLFINDIDSNIEMSKMFNVAITRARFCLCMVGNFKYLMQRGRGNALDQLLRHLLEVKKIKTINAVELLEDIVFEKSDVALLENRNAKTISCKTNSFYDYFIADIKEAKKSIVIYSPFITENRLSKILPSFVDAIRRGVTIIVLTKDRTERKRTEIGAYIKCEQEMKRQGIKVIYKKNMHEKLIFIDDDIYWCGSLNALSATGLTGEIMIRYLDSADQANMRQFNEIEHLIEVVDGELIECPICHKEMICRESQKGGVYWECNKCGYTRNKKQIYPREGRLVCEKCNAALKFDMRNNPGWVCEGEKPHFRQLQIRDLKLPRMRELIPKEKIEEVEKRFAISSGISEDIDCKIDEDERNVSFIPTTDGDVAQLVMNFDE